MSEIREYFEGLFFILWCSLLASERDEHLSLSRNLLMENPLA